ncbi:MAG: Bicyclomycin resistance protein [Pseudomonadota bacterium]|jgi:predicted MFS family arabinose efflux permease
MFLSFAAAYFISAALRTVTATMAPILTQEFSLEARDLGLLSGGYFLGFAVLQIPLGAWLDRFGPRRVILTMLTIAVLGCVVFANANSFHSLLLARFLCGLGVSVCLMAPLTAYRRWFNPETQLRANSWMLMTGSLGMLCATLPVQAALPWLGWRGIFWMLAGLVLLCLLLIALFVPSWHKTNQDKASDGIIWRNPDFARMVPIGFVLYGGMIAVQTLWVGPWMTKVAGYTPEQAAGGLFAINFAMLLNYWCWGWLNPKLAASGWDAVRLIRFGLPFSLIALPTAFLIATDIPLMVGLSIPIWFVWIFYFISSSFVSLAQPAVGMAFPNHMAGRALTTYNLIIFMGVFTVQWAIGLGIDLFLWLGFGTVKAYQAAFGVFWLCCLASFMHFWRHSNVAQG